MFREINKTCRKPLITSVERVQEFALTLGVLIQSKGIFMKRALCLVGMGVFCVATVRADRFDDLEKKIDALTSLQEQTQSELTTLKSQLGSNAFVDAKVPSTQPSATNAKLNRLGPWQVVIGSNVPPEPVSIETQMRNEETKLPNLQKTFDDKQSHYQSMAAETVRTTDRTGNDSYGNGIYQTITRQKYSPTQLGMVSADAARAKEELQQQKQKVARLRRDLDTANNSWNGTGTLDDGTSVDISGQGAVPKQLVSQMQAGQHFRLEGTSSLNAGRLTINVRSATILMP